MNLMNGRMEGGSQHANNDTHIYMIDIDSERRRRRRRRSAPQDAVRVCGVRSQVLSCLDVVMCTNPPPSSPSSHPRLT